MVLHHYVFQDNESYMNGHIFKGYSGPLTPGTSQRSTPPREMLSGHIAKICDEGSFMFYLYEKLKDTFIWLDVLRGSLASQTQLDFQRYCSC